MSDGVSLRGHAMSGLIWSLIQNWGGKAVSLLVFVLLARLLQPSEFGIASSVFLIMTMLSLIAEFGLSEALVQRRILDRADVTLPFALAMSLSVALALVTAIFAETISDWMGVEGLAPYLRAAVAICPLMTASTLQEALYRRNFRFKPLAIRTLTGVFVGGAVGVIMAFAGYGTWALIAQFAVQMGISIVWLWLKPEWVPTRRYNAASFAEITRFGGTVFSTYLLDFVTMKSVDFIILIVHGPVALGLYTVASRLYQLLLQLLQSSISGVGLTMLSKVSHDLPRMQRLYERSSSFSALLGLPIFFGFAALAPEVNNLMFGPKWAGADRLMVPLLLIGGIHCIQYLNAAYLTSLGQPTTLVRLGLYKAIVILPPLYLLPLEKLSSTVDLYALSLLILTPLSFGATLKAMSLGWSALIRPVGAPLLSVSLAFGAVMAARQFGTIQPEPVLLAALYFGAIFALTYVVAVAVLAFGTAKDTLQFAIGAFRR